VSDPTSGKHRTLLVSQDIVGERMTGPGIRYWHLAQALAPHADVTLAVPHDSPPDIGTPGVKISRYARLEWASLQPLVEASEIVVCPSDIISDFPELGGSQVCLVVDGYVPLLAEWLALNSFLDTESQNALWWQRMCALNQQYLLGDFYICASERQRDWWLGLLEASGRINAFTFRDDPSLRRLVDTVPFGVPPVPPRHTRQVIKGVWPGIGLDDRLLLWGGGLWPWLDPLTAVRAVAYLWPQRQDLRLVFPGIAHPNPWMSQMPTQLEATRQLAAEAGLLDRAVFFGDWIAYADWPSVLLESDVALALAFDTLETRLAFRSRVIEYAWAGLPCVITGGDATADLAASHDLGIVVPPGGIREVAGAIERLLALAGQDRLARFAPLRESLSWERTAWPLIEFCRHPRRAPDRVAMGDRFGNPFYIAEKERVQDRLTRERDLYAHEGQKLVEARDELLQEVARLADRAGWRGYLSRIRFGRIWRSRRRGN
jgi:glycosyltransferase involved in cell wall biosynthesis